MVKTSQRLASKYERFGLSPFDRLSVLRYDSNECALGSAMTAGGSVILFVHLERSAELAELTTAKTSEIEQGLAGCRSLCAARGHPCRDLQ
jgi:hypothetical protein